MNNYFIIKDQCRKGLIKYLENACSNIPNINNPNILDAGCGTGVPALWLADNLSGIITAIDIDKESINYLQQKISHNNLQNRVEVLCASFLDYKFDFNHFDIILAEGLLNIVGFEAGFEKAIKILKKSGYFIIHDEDKGYDKKCEFINENNCIIIDTFYLDETTWWEDYYRQLETEINKIMDSKTYDLFKSDLEEIKNIKTDPSQYRSIYYVIKKI